MQIVESVVPSAASQQTVDVNAQATDLNHATELLTTPRRMTNELEQLTNRQTVDVGLEQVLNTSNEAQSTYIATSAPRANNPASDTVHSMDTVALLDLLTQHAADTVTSVPETTISESVLDLFSSNDMLHSEQLSQTDLREEVIGVREEQPQVNNDVNKGSSHETGHEKIVKAPIENKDSTENFNQETVERVQHSNEMKQKINHISHTEDESLLSELPEPLSMSRLQSESSLKQLAEKVDELPKAPVDLDVTPIVHKVEELRSTLKEIELSDLQSVKSHGSPQQEVIRASRIRFVSTPPPAASQKNDSDANLWYESNADASFHTIVAAPGLIHSSSSKSNGSNVSTPTNASVANITPPNVSHGSGITRQLKKLFKRGSGQISGSNHTLDSIADENGSETIPIPIGSGMSHSVDEMRSITDMNRPRTRSRDSLNNLSQHSLVSTDSDSKSQVNENNATVSNKKLGLRERLGLRSSSAHASPLPNETSENPILEADANGEATPNSTEVKRSHSLHPNWRMTRKLTSSQSKLSFSLQGNAASSATTNSDPNKNTASKSLDSLNQAVTDGTAQEAVSVASPTVPNSKEKEERRRQVTKHITYELLETEKSFANSLQIMLDHFLAPIKAVIKTDKQIMSAVDTRIVFTGIPELLAFTQNLADDLQQFIQARESEQWITSAATEIDIAKTVVVKEDLEALVMPNESIQVPSVSDVFLKRLETNQFQIYIKFVDNYAPAKAALRRAEESPNFRAFHQECLLKKETLRQGIADFLIMPIQRITRYVLLLQDLKKHSSPEHSDYARLTLAVDQIRALANHVNEVKRKEEEMTRMFEVQKAVADCPPTVISATRRVLLELDAMDLQRHKPGRLIVFSDLLLIAKVPSQRVLGVRKEKLPHYKMMALWQLKDVTLLEGDEPCPTSDKAIVKFIYSGAGHTLTPRTASNHSMERDSSSTHSGNAESSPGQSGTDTLMVFQLPGRKEKMELVITIQNAQRQLKHGSGNYAPQ